MSDQKHEDNKALHEQETEEEDLFSALQSEFDALLSEEKQPSVTEVDSDLANQFDSDFESLEAMNATPDEKVVIAEELEMEQIIDGVEPSPAESEADLAESAQSPLEADALEHEDSSEVMNNSINEPHAFAGETSAAFEAIKTEGKESPDNISKVNHASDEISPFNDPSLPGMQDDLDIFENEASGEGDSPEWEPIPAESSADISSGSMASQTRETAPVAAPPPRPSSKEKWISMIFITFGLVAISLALWLKVIPIGTETKVVSNSPVDNQSAQLATHAQDATDEKPVQIAKKPMSVTSEADIDKAEKAAASKAELQTAARTASAVAEPVLVSKPITPVTSISQSSKTKKPVSVAKNMPPASKTATKKVVKKQTKAAVTAKSIWKDAAVSSEAASGSGNWSVILSSVSSEKTAIQQQARMRASGVEAQYVLAIKNGRVLYRIQVDGFNNKREAEKQLAILSKKLGTRSAWVSKL